MRAYTLSILTQLAESGNPIVEAEIIQWVNNKLQNAGKGSSIRNFQESSLANAIAVIDLVDAIKPGTINYEMVKLSGSEEVSNLIRKLFLINIFVTVLFVSSIFFVLFFCNIFPLKM